MIDPSEISLRIINIIEGTSVDGPGLRTAIYFAGCDHHCHGCHNPQTWPHNAGMDMSIDEILNIVRNADFNVTLTGGDPLYQSKKLKPLVEEISKLGKTIWLYTGFTYEELIMKEEVRDILPYIEAIVDGPYIDHLRNVSIPFRGSENQRIIYVNKC